MTQKTVLVTGGAGFIGSNLVDKLLKLGYKVICIDNFDNYYPARYKRQNIKDALKDTNYTLYEYDVTDYKKIATVFKLFNVDSIVHLAGRGGVFPSMEKPLVYTKTNIDGTLCMLEAARYHGVGQFIFSSSSSVYGSNSKIPFREDDYCDDQSSPYGVTKRSAELLIHTYHNLYGLKSTILRFFNVYGPRCRPDMALYKFTRLILASREVEDWTTKRDFTYVDDVATAIINALQKPTEFEIINIGSSKLTPMRQYIEAIAISLGTQAKITKKEPKSAELVIKVADISKAKRLLGFNPKTRVKDGVANFVAWFKKNQRNLNQLPLH